MTTNTLPPISDLLSGYSFNTSPPGTPLELTYSFETSVPTSGSWAYDPTWTEFSSAEQVYVQQAMANVGAFADVTFNEVTGTAEINYGNSTSSNQDLMGTSFGKTELPTPENPVAYTAFNGADFTPTPFYPPADNDYLATHELGNALGLLDFYGPVTTWLIPTQYTNSDYTTMAGVTFNESHNSPPNFENPVGFQMLDILALQYLYGVNENGYTPSYQGTTATITSTSLTYSITSNSAPETIWVGSNVASVKCFDFSECTSPVVINLNAGAFSSNYVGPALNAGFAAGANDSIAIAINTVVNVGVGNNQADTLIADSTPGHNDILVGGTGNDIFTAGAGKDIFIGGGGIDTAVFHDPEADYDITNVGSGVIVVTDDAVSPTDGTVVLDGSFTSLQFADQTVAETANMRPSGLTTVVSAPAAIIAANLDGIDYLLNKGTVSSLVETDHNAGTYTAADVNGWFQTINGLPPTAPSIPTTDVNLYVAQLIAGSETPTQVQASLENPAVFYRTSVADFVLREFQAAWGVFPTTGAGSQYDNWVARIIANPSLENGGMSEALSGTPQFQEVYGVTGTTIATLATVQTFALDLLGIQSANLGPGALANVGLPVWQVLQNFAQSSQFIADKGSSIVAFQTALLESDPVATPVPSTHTTEVGSDMVQLTGLASSASHNVHFVA